MLRVKYDTREFMQILRGTVAYGEGFASTVVSEANKFNWALAKHINDICLEYVDAYAAMNPDELHHMYEWGATGSKNARLFEMHYTATFSSINFWWNYLQSNSMHSDMTEPFVDKALVMERGLTVVIRPKNAEILHWERGGEDFFSMMSVIEHPGGPAVAGSFTNVITDFFENYVPDNVINPIMRDMATPDEFAKYFSAGARGGFTTGRRAARQYLNIDRKVL